MGAIQFSLRRSYGTMKLTSWNQSVRKLDKEIAKLMKGTRKHWFLAAGIIAEIGDIKRFDNYNALAKYAGLVWNQHQSGEFEAEDTKRVLTGNKYLRYYLVQAANCVRKHDTEYKSFYQKKYDEVPKHKHKRALVLTARKLVRLVYMLLSTNKLYTPLERRG